MNREDEAILEYARNSVELALKREVSAERQAILFDNYLILGDFDNARTNAPNQKKITFLDLVIEAMNKEDATDCSCRKNRYVQGRRFFSPRHGRMISLSKCAGCGDYNAV